MPSGPLTSPTAVAHAFEELQNAFLSSTPLMLPNPNKPFLSYTTEKTGTATAVLVQPVGPRH